mgnify:CR=1 FL=1
MKITVCIGSSCHLKGSRQVTEKLQELIAVHNLKDDIKMSGTFCMNNCQKGVCVTVDGELFSLSPETTEEFFEKEILTRVK